MTDVTHERQPATDPNVVTINLDGREVEARAGEMIIAAAERAGTYIPRFCYHPRMRPVGMCRMCLVEVVGPRGPSLQPACFVPVAEGQEIITTSATVKKAQDSVLELLLVNHPLDCPVCDRGGECPLQDHTMSFGPGETRFVEEKRHWEKPISLSPLVDLDRERCIQCDRCTRFADEIAGDPLIDFQGRGAHTEVNTFPDSPFSSYFSGNTVQLCPVGALLAVPYRFRARPWDLEQVESTCTSCAVGCRVALQSSNDVLLRKLGVDVEPVNQGWLCDKGRFDYEAVGSEARLTRPLVRSGDGRAETSWADAMRRTAEALASAREGGGATAIGVLGGARLTNEDAYAWSKLARTVLGTDNVDCQLDDGLPAELVLGLPRATIAEAARADLLVLLTADVKEELPVLYLRLRQAAVEAGARIVEISPTSSGLTRYAATSARCVPGDPVATVRELAAAGAFAGAERPVCVLGRPSLAEPAEAVEAAAAALLEAVPGLRFLSGLRRANVHGALDMGLAPGILPGRVALEDGRPWFTEAWGTLPAGVGAGAQGILSAAAEGRLQALVLLGADPLADFPDRDLARRALAGAGFVLSLDALPNASNRLADVVLPVAMYGEKAGSTTNLEGRVTRLHQKVTPPGTARADWMVAVDLARRLGGDLGFETADAIEEEIARLAPAYLGIDRPRLVGPRALDGILAGSDAASPEAPVPTEAHAEAVEVHAVETQGSDEVVAVSPEPEVVAPAPAPAAPLPPLLVASPEPAPSAPPPPDSYSFRLVTHRRLYDNGTIVQHSPSLERLAPGGGVALNPADLERIGIAAGATVRVASSRTSVTLPVSAEAGVPRGAAFIAFNQPGSGAADLVDSTAPATEIRIESA